jgi:hypothetical protein
MHADVSRVSIQDAHLVAGLVQGMSEENRYCALASATFTHDPNAAVRKREIAFGFVTTHGETLSAFF